VRWTKAEEARGVSARNARTKTGFKMTWRKIAGGEKRYGKFATYEHPYSGWRIQHCGHATALTPFYLEEPGTGREIVSRSRTGFRNLAAAQSAVAFILAGVTQTIVLEDGLPVVEHVNANGTLRGGDA
jgi:hypothetical protein